jgi:hypothetical protein
MGTSVVEEYKCTGLVQDYKGCRSCTAIQEKYRGTEVKE